MNVHFAVCDEPAYVPSGDKRQEDTIPIYSTSNNKEMSSADEEELMRLMKGEK